MYYEEKIIDGILCWRSGPNDPWTRFSMKDLSQRAKQLDAVTKERDELKQQVQAAQEALQLLIDHQNGCPLPKYEKEWNRAMELARQALHTIARYGKDGICPYGCDTPAIAEAALKEAP